jgi:hypothetical protein
MNKHITEETNGQYSNYKLSLKTSEYELGEEISFKPIEMKKSGQSKFGNWYLWRVYIDNEFVTCFPSERLNNIFNNNKGQVITLKKQIIKSKTGKEFILLDLPKFNIPLPEQKPVLGMTETNSEGERVQEKDVILKLQEAGYMDNKPYWIETFKQYNVNQSRIDLLYKYRAELI